MDKEWPIPDSIAEWQRLAIVSEHLIDMFVGFADEHQNERCGDLSRAVLAGGEPLTVAMLEAAQKRDDRVQKLLRWLLPELS